MYFFCKNGRKLTRTLRDMEVKQMLSHPEGLYYARFGTNFSHEADTQSDSFLRDGDYSDVMIELQQTDVIGFHGRIHPISSAPHLLKVDRVYWNKTNTWYTSVNDFRTAFQKPQ